jgi:hypothetical protein
MLVLITIDVSSEVPSCILPGAQMALMNHQDWSNTQDSVVCFCVMSVRSQPRLRVSILFYCPREYHLRSYRWSIQFRSSYPNSWCCPRHWKLRKFLFHSEHPLELLLEEGQVIKHNTSRIMKHNLNLQGALSPTRRRKKLHERPRRSPPSNGPDILVSPWSTHPTSFLVFLLLSYISGWDFF